MAVTGFEQFFFDHDGKSRPVYTRGSGPAVIVCHELPGLSPKTFELALRIRSEGFSVFVPLLFGSPGQESSLRGAIQLCLSREFNTLALGKTSRVSRYLTALAAEAEKRSGRTGVAMIGMCATGGVVLATLLSKSVRVAVASQPALPASFPGASAKRRSDLGLSPDHLSALEAAPKPILALRFKHDSKCPAERLQALDARLGKDNVAVIEIPTSGTYDTATPPIRKGAHSVLTYDLAFDSPEHPTRAAYDRVIAFLHDNLDAKDKES